MPQTEDYLPLLDDLRRDFPRSVLQLRASLDLGAVQFLGGYANVGPGVAKAASHIAPDVATVAIAEVEVPLACQLGNLRLRLDVAPAGAETMTASLYKNGIVTALSLVLTGAAVTGLQSTTFIDFVAGDRYAIHFLSSGAAPIINAKATIEGRNTP